MPLQRGQIVVAWVSDPQNRNPKRRPLVIVTATEDIKPDEPFLAVAITGTFSQPLPGDHVALPWHPKKHPKTGLTKPSAAVCSWLESITAADVEAHKGRVPDKELLLILTKVKEYGQSPSSPEDANGEDTSP